MTTGVGIEGFQFMTLFDRGMQSAKIHAYCDVDNGYSKTIRKELNEQNEERSCWRDVRPVNRGNCKT